MQSCTKPADRTQSTPASVDTLYVVRGAGISINR